MRKLTSIAFLVCSTAIGSQAIANAPPSYGDVSPDGGWIYVGGDSGWDPAPHRFISSNGQWVHEDRLAHDTPRPAWLTLAERERQIPRPGGAPHELKRVDGRWIHVDRLPHNAPRPAMPTNSDGSWREIEGD